MPEDTLIAFVAGRPAGEPGADTLAAWRADATTVRPIPLGPLTAYLRTTGLDDVLAGAAASDATPADARTGLRRFLAHVADQRQSVLDTTDPVIAAQTAGVLSALLGARAATPEQAAAILALGGGPRHGPAMERDVTDARGVVARRAAWDALNNARFADDAARQSKLNYLTAHPDVPPPADLAALDAWEIPGGEG